MKKLSFPFASIAIVPAGPIVVAGRMAALDNDAACFRLTDAVAVRP